MRAYNMMETLEARQLLSANLVADFGGFYPTDTANVDGESYFAANDGVHGLELWKSDGTTSGTQLVKDITPGKADTNIQNLYAVNGRVVFFVEGAQSEETLWVSDGTSAGTKQLLELHSTQTPTAAVLMDRLIFLVTQTDDKGVIYTTDGTSGGSFILNPNSINKDAGGGSAIQIVGAKAIIFQSGHLWSTDDTVANTVEIPFPALQPNWTINLANSVDASGELLFTTTTDPALWETDGTVAGTKMIIALPGIGTIQKDNGLIAVNSGNLHQLWTTDGTAAGTFSIADLSSDIIGSGGIGYKTIFVVGGGSGSELWTTDKTTAGTFKFAALGKGLIFSNFASADGLVFFVTSDLNKQVLLWKTDGSEAGTSVVQDMTNPNIGIAWDVTLTNVNDQLLITTDDDTLPQIMDPSTMTAPVGPHQAFISLTDGVLRIFGTQDDDNIHIYQMPHDHSRFVVNLNGVKQSFAIADVSRMYIYGYSGNDNIAVSEKYGKLAVRSRIWGGDGNDIIYTGGGRDTIYGENGDDTLGSGNNDDIDSGGNGDDDISAGNGNDSASGDDGADTVMGNKGNDVISGGDDGSHDHLDAGDGQNVIFGQAVYDIFFSGVQGTDHSGFNDVLIS